MKRFFRFALMVVALTMCSLSAARADYDDAMTAYSAGNYAPALTMLKSLATQGDAKAQGQLGWMYVKGRGVLQDDARTLMWWNIAASNGNETSRKNRDSLAKAMSQCRLEEAQRLARECLQKNKKGVETAHRQIDLPQTFILK